MNTSSIIKKFSFAAAHRLIETVPQGHPCSNLHGHNYECEIEIVTKEVSGMIIDFSDLKKIINSGIDEWDHTLILNKHDPLRLVLESFKTTICLVIGDPTVENMTCILVYQFLSSIKEALQVPLISLTIRMHETANSIGTYTYFEE